MFQWLRSLFGSRAPAFTPAQRELLRAAYDVAKTTAENRRRWAGADSLGPINAANPNERQTIRDRARYQYANNSYCKGIVRTRANHVVGCGPTLRVLLEDQAANRQIEEAWHAWDAASRFSQKLLQGAVAKIVDGETFGLLVTNDALDHSVKLDVRIIEADQVRTPGFVPMGGVDGIEYDKAGNPTVYHVLKQHPGDGWLGMAYDRVPARSVLHWYLVSRPGLPRGISELASALILFSHLQTFTLATVTAAETAALVSAVLKTTTGPWTENVQTPDTGFDLVEFVRGMLMTLPQGYDIHQLKAEHPQTTYEMFVWVLLREIARCLNMPLTVAALDSSKSNFSSSRLDHQIFRQDCELEREGCGLVMCEPTFAAWLDEATRIPKLLPAGTPADARSLPHVFDWPTWPYLDPLVDRQAITEGLTNGSMTPQQVAAQQGDDWREMITQRLEAEAWEAQERQRLGLQAPAEQDPAAQQDRQARQRQQRQDRQERAAA